MPVLVIIHISYGSYHHIFPFGFGFLLPDTVPFDEKQYPLLNMLHIQIHTILLSESFSRK